MRRSISFMAALAVTLFLAVSPVSADTGEGPPPVPIAVDLTIDSATIDLRTGIATISGTITCDQEAYGYVYGEVRQNVGRFFTVQGGFWADVACSTTPSVFTGTAQPWNGKFAGGYADVSAWADVWGGTEDAPAYGSDFYSARVLLRR